MVNRKDQTRLALQGKWHINVPPNFIWIGHGPGFHLKYYVICWYFYIKPSFGSAESRITRGLYSWHLKLLEVLVCFVLSISTILREFMWLTSLVREHRHVCSSVTGIILRYMTKDIPELNTTIIVHGKYNQYGIFDLVLLILIDWVKREVCIYHHNTIPDTSSRQDFVCFFAWLWGDIFVGLLFLCFHSCLW